MRIPHAKTLFSPGPILALILAFTSLPALARVAPEPTLVVQADGQVSVAPDMATVILGSEHRARTARQAMDLLKDDLEGIMARLSEAGIADRDMQSAGLTLHPHRDYDRSKSLKAPEFVASSVLTVTVRDLDTLGALLDSVIRDGANLFRGLSFGLQDPAPVRDAARKAAVAEALRRGALYAEAAGVPLGPITLITEAPQHGSAPIHGLRAEATSFGSSVPIATGQVTFDARVTVTFGPTPSALRP